MAPKWYQRAHKDCPMCALCVPKVRLQHGISSVAPPVWRQRGTSETQRQAPALTQVSHSEARARAPHVNPRSRIYALRCRFHPDTCNLSHPGWRPPAWRLQLGAPSLAPPAWRPQPGASNLAPPAWRLQPGASSLAPPAWRLHPGASSLASPAWRLTPGASSLAHPAWRRQPGASSLAPPA